MAHKEDQTQAYAGANNCGSLCSNIELLAGCSRKTERGLEALGSNTHLWQALPRKNLTVLRLIQHTPIMKLWPLSVMTYRSYPLM